MKAIFSFFTRFNSSYFFTTPEDSRLIFFWIALYIILVVVSFFLYYTYKEMAKSEKPYLAYAKSIFWINFGLGLSGLILIFMRYEKANFLSWRVWQYLIVLIFVLVDPYLFTLRRRKLERDLLKYRDQKRKEKWLSKGKKK